MRYPRFLISCVGMCLVACAQGTEPSWTALFNGRDLSGWETYLATPHPSSIVPELAKGADGNYVGHIGLNRDPLKVFSVVEVDGQAALRFSGEIFGVLRTTSRFSNYRLRLQFKWGKQKWPAKTGPRDSGLLYHTQDELDVTGIWPRCLELQIQEGTCGDLHALGMRVQVAARLRQQEKLCPVYDPHAEMLTLFRDSPLGKRCAYSANFEKESGAWNSIELVCWGAQSAHIVNGQVVLRVATGERAEGTVMVPATNGRIALQTEGSEVFFRAIEIQPLTELPAELKK